MPDERASTDRMQHLRQARAHACALSCGEDDGREVVPSHAPPPGLEPRPNSSKGCRAAITPRRITASAERMLPLKSAMSWDTERMSELDEVDRIVGAWNTQRPDLDFAPLEVLSRVDRLTRLLDRARRDVFRRSDLEPWEWDVLSALRRAGSPFQLSPKQLLQQTLVSSGTMTNRIDRLVGRRFVRREADPGDGRSVLVTLTDDGRIRVDAAIPRLVDVEADLLQALSRADRDRLAALLRKLSLSFDA